MKRKPGPYRALWENYQYYCPRFLVLVQYRVLEIDPEILLLTT